MKIAQRARIAVIVAIMSGSVFAASPQARRPYLGRSCRLARVQDAVDACASNAEPSSNIAIARQILTPLNLVGFLRRAHSIGLHRSPP